MVTWLIRLKLHAANRREARQVWGILQPARASWKDASCPMGPSGPSSDAVAHGTTHGRAALSEHIREFSVCNVTVIPAFSAPGTRCIGSRSMGVTQPASRSVPLLDRRDSLRFCGIACLRPGVPTANSGTPPSGTAGPLPRTCRPVHPSGTRPAEAW
jgi:hypothetical protein